MEQEEIVLKLGAHEINLVLEGIGNLPFVKVYGLVSKIQTQASSQLGRGPSVVETTEEGSD